MEKELLELPGKVEHQRSLIAKCEEDFLCYRSWKKENPPATETHLKKEEAERRKVLREYIASAVRDYALETREKISTKFGTFLLILLYRKDVI